MSQLALELIKKEKRERTGKLDLGKCGLVDHWPEELFELDWLEELIICNRWRDWEQGQWIESKNPGAANFFSVIPDSLGKLVNVKKIKIGGDYPSIWSFTDCVVIEKFINLKSLYLSFNQIESVH